MVRKAKDLSPDELYQATWKRIKDRFDVMQDFTHAALDGMIRSMIVSGPPGLGKSFAVEQALKKWDSERQRHIIIKGFVKTTGLMRMLYKFRHPENVVVFDDADSLFWDEDSMNLLKTVCDTCEERYISYLSEYKLEDEDGERIPERFQFEGSVIFLTNLNFDNFIGGNNRLAPHFAALVSRSHYIDLTLNGRDDYLIRIDQVIKEGMLDDMDKTQRQEVIDFVWDNARYLRELSLRMVIKIANIRKMEKKNWKDVAMITCCRNEAVAT